MVDPVACALNQVADRVLDESFVPPQSTLLAIRRFNGAMAILFARHSLGADDKGNVFSVARGEAGPAVVEDPEPA